MLSPRPEIPGPYRTPGAGIICNLSVGKDTLVQSQMITGASAEAPVIDLVLHLKGSYAQPVEQPLHEHGAVAHLVGRPPYGSPHRFGAITAFTHSDVLKVVFRERVAMRCHAPCRLSWSCMRP